ncbi:uncharacterized protein ACMZJ9_017092 [Mantella aurantiaca]
MKGSLFRDFIVHYEAGSREGSAVLCGGRPGGAAPGLHYTQLIRDNFARRKRQDRDDVIVAHMIKGFAILELICVNLFLYPWRKEIRTLKKFTGNFVYFVEPVIPEKTVQQILQRVGYSIVRETEYIIGGTINVEEAKLAAFELYLARLHCENLLRLMREKRSDCANLLNIETEKENPEQCSNRNGRIGNTEQSDDTTTESRIPKSVHRKDSKRSTGFSINDDSRADFYSRHLDSEEFLNKYSDLNLAQQPLLPLQNRKINVNPQEAKEEMTEELYEEPKLAKPCMSESSGNEPEPDLYKEKDLDYNTASENMDTRAAGHNTLDSNKPPAINKPPIEVNMPNKQTPSERLVIKLKMGKMADEMAYPIEETLPPDPKEFTYGSPFCQKDPKWTCLKDREAVEDVAGSASLSAGFSMLSAASSRGAEGGGIDSLHRLREPPSSMYIPPGGTERQCLRLTDLQTEDNHFQAPSPPGDLVQVNETLYNMHEDTKEDFVMITKKPQS